MKPFIPAESRAAATMFRFGTRTVLHIPVSGFCADFHDETAP